MQEDRLVSMLALKIILFLCNENIKFSRNSMYLRKKIIYNKLFYRVFPTTATMRIILHELLK